MAGINKVALVVSKTIEILHWVGMLFGAVLFVSSILAQDWLNGLYVKGIITVDENAAFYGYEMNVLDEAGKLNMTAAMLFALAVVFILPLGAMIFRNVSKVVKSADTPFSEDNIRRIREIGIFSISVPVVSFIMSIISQIVLDGDMIKIVVDADGIIMGILALFLTQIFIHGAELEKDVNGLL